MVFNNCIQFLNDVTNIYLQKFQPKKGKKQIGGMTSTNTPEKLAIEKKKFIVLW